MERFAKEALKERLDKLQKRKTNIIKEKERRRNLYERRVAIVAARYVKEGLPYAEKIFKWAKKFKNSDIGRQFFSLIEPDPDGVKTMRLGSLPTSTINIRDGDGLIGYLGRNYKGEYINNYCASNPMTLALWASPEALKATYLTIKRNPSSLYDDMIGIVLTNLSCLEHRS